MEYRWGIGGDLVEIKSLYLIDYKIFIVFLVEQSKKSEQVDKLTSKRVVSCSEV